MARLGAALLTAQRHGHLVEGTDRRSVGGSTGVLCGACSVALAPEDSWAEYSQNASH